MAEERVSNGLMLLTRNPSTLCLMLGATHLVTQSVTLVEQSSQARLQAGLADSLCVDYPAQVTTPWLMFGEKLALFKVK